MRARLRGPKPLDHLLARAVQRHPLPGEHLRRHFLGKRQQPEDEVLGADVMVSELPGLAAGGGERVGGAARQPERGVTHRRQRDDREALLSRLLARLQRAADLGPARALRAGGVHDLVKQLVAARV